MIRRSPAEVYIKYLLLHPEGYTTERIVDILREMQLDFLSAGYIDRLRQQVQPPEVFRPFDRRHNTSHRFLLLNGLVSIFHQNKDAQLAFELVGLPRAKEFIESSVLSGAPKIAIATYLTRHDIKRCTASSLEKYCSFFWDLTLLDSTEMRALLQMRSESSLTHPDIEVRRQAEPMRRAFWSDPRKLAADLPSSPHTALIAQVKMGVMPHTLDKAKVLENTLNILSVRILEAALNNGPKDSTRALEFANALRVVKEVKDVIIPADEQLKKDLRVLALKTDDAPRVSLQALTKGNHAMPALPPGATERQTLSDEMEEEDDVNPFEGEEEDDGEEPGTTDG